MVTLNNQIKQVTTFRGDLKEQRLEYETAKQGLANLEYACNQFVESIKGACDTANNYNLLNMPKETTNTKMKIGEVDFTILSWSDTRRPSYQGIVSSWVTNLDGLVLAANEGKAITGMPKHDDKYWLETVWARNYLFIPVCKSIQPVIAHEVVYDAPQLVEAAKNPELVIDLGNDLKELNLLKPKNALNYVLMREIRSDLECFVKNYEDKLNSKLGKRKEDTVPISETDAYEVRKIKSKGPNWPQVVKRMILVPTDKKCVGELDILADVNLSLTDRMEMKLEDGKLKNLYTLWVPEGKASLYLSIPSIINRIDELKEEDPVKSKRLTVENKDIV
jgi:hypothetical protein